MLRSFFAQEQRTGSFAVRTGFGRGDMQRIVNAVIPSGVAASRMRSRCGVEGPAVRRRHKRGNPFLRGWRGTPRGPPTWLRMTGHLQGAVASLVTFVLPLHSPKVAFLLYCG